MRYKALLWLKTCRQDDRVLDAVNLHAINHRVHYRGLDVCRRIWRPEVASVVFLIPVRSFLWYSRKDNWQLCFSAVQRL